MFFFIDASYMCNHVLLLGVPGLNRFVNTTKKLCFYLLISMYDEENGNESRSFVHFDVWDISRMAAVSPKTTLNKILNPPFNWCQTEYRVSGLLFYV